MDLIYGKRSLENGQEDSSKRPKLNSTGDLPIHLPNLPTQIFGSTSDSKSAAPENSTGETASGKQNPGPQDAGSDIVLESRSDIDEWIRKRKENWMKKISNRRVEGKEDEKPEENTNEKGDAPPNPQDAESEPQSKPVHPQKKDYRQNNQRGYGNQNQTNRNSQNRPSDQHPHTSQRSRAQPQRFNLNNALLQRELSRENTKILEVIKELFDRGVLPKP